MIKTNEKRVNALETWCLGIKRLGRISNNTIRKAMRVALNCEKLRERRLRWFEHERNEMERGKVQENEVGKPRTWNQADSALLWDKCQKKYKELKKWPF